MTRKKRDLLILRLLMMLWGALGVGFAMHDRWWPSLVVLVAILGSNFCGFMLGQITSGMYAADDEKKS